MTKLEVKDKMSPVELGIVVISTVLGAQIITSAGTISESAKQSAWLAVVLSGIVSIAAALVLLRLGQLYPKDSIVEFLPKIIGYPLATAVLIGLILFYAVELALILRQFINTISFYMFDRTPPEVLALLFVAVVAYGAAQDWGTLLRIVQFFYFTTTTLLFVFTSMLYLNFEYNNLLPWWPQDFSGLLKGMLESWDIFSGYEIILLILPLVYRGQTSLTKTVAGSLMLVTFMYATGMILLTGTLTSGIASAVQYPTVVAMRSVELPGTFIERIENYFLLVWVPTVYLSFTLSYYGMSFLCNRLTGLKDQRIFVYFFAPLILTGMIIIDSPEAINRLDFWGNAVGALMSFVFFPLLYGIALWRRKDEG